MPTCTFGRDEGECPLVESLLRQGADPNVVGDAEGIDDILLLWALRMKRFGLAHNLLEQSADINQEGPLALPFIGVACFGILRAAEFLLLRRADFEKTGYSAFENLKPVNLKLVRHSPLYWARKYSERNMVQLLLQHGAKDGPDSKPHQHEPDDCPNGPQPGGLSKRVGTGYRRSAGNGTLQHR